MTTGHHFKKWVDKNDLHDATLHRKTNRKDAVPFRAEKRTLCYAVRKPKNAHRNRYAETGVREPLTCGDAIRFLTEQRLLHHRLVAPMPGTYNDYRAFPEMPHRPVFAAVTLYEDHKLYRLVTRDHKKRPVSTLVTAYHPADALVQAHVFLSQYDVTHVRVVHLLDNADLTDSERKTLRASDLRLLAHT